MLFDSHQMLVVEDIEMHGTINLLPNIVSPGI